MRSNQKRKGLSRLILSLGALALLALGPRVYGQETKPKELTLGEVLRLAEKESPSLKASVSRENESREFTRAADSGFFPSLGLDAVASNGFPGSSSGFGTSGLNGFPGLAASPYRAGPAADAYAKWDLLDVSVWHQSAAAHYEYQASQERTKLQSELVDQQALRVYLEAVRVRGDQEAWQKLADELSGIRDIVKRFVRNGQYSEVQGLLIEDQLADAALRAGDYGLQYQAALQRLALLTGQEAKTISCPAPLELSGEEATNLTTTGPSPLITQAEFEVKSAKETTAKYSAQNLPVLEVAGSAGYLSGTRLEPAQDYSLFVGVSLPLFEGFRIDAQEKAARSEAEARQSEVSADQLALKEFNIQYDEQVSAALEELKILGDETERSVKAATLAKQRYLSFLGPLSDLQQALKDKVNLDIQTADTKTRFFSAAVSRYLLNGGTSENLK